MKMIKKSKINSSQQGVFLPISAVVALGILTFLFLLVGYTGRVKVAQSELRAKLDIACGDVVLEETYTRRMEKFKDRVEELNIPGALRYSKLTAANLIMPTMPENGTFAFPPANLQPVGGDAPLIVPCGQDLNCKVFRSITAIDSGPPQRVIANDYPPRLWNNLRNAGNTIACEFKANVKADFLSPYFRNKLNPEYFDLSMKSVWWSPIRGPIPSYVDTDDVNTSPGLTIAIGTEMFTTSWDERFRFKNDLNLNQFNPLRRANRFFSQVDSVSTSHPPIGGSTPVIPQVIPPSANEPFAEIGTANMPPRPANFDNALSITNPSTWNHPASDRDGLLTACMNPLILVRNTLLSVIVELAGRHGQLRNMTEILHMNPMHRDPKFYPASGYIPNYPSRIVAFGQDIVERQFHMPYVFFHSGKDTNPLLNTNASSAYAWYKALGFDSYPTLGGFINPFESSAATTTWEKQSNPDRAKIHALVASQLRLCQNLYGPNFSGSDEDIPRNGLFQNFLNESADFEPEIYDDYRMLGTGDWVSNRRRANNLGNWDQQCSYPGICTPNAENNEKMSAAQIMSSLGSTQLCPFSYKYNNNPDSEINTVLDNAIAGTGPTLSGGYPCPLTYPPSYSGSGLPASLSAGSSSADMPLELLPDLLGTLRYIRKAQDDIELPGLFPFAIDSPGLFPLKPNSESVLPTDSPFVSPESLVTTQNDKSAILLLMHQPLTGSDLLSQIQSEITQLVKGAESNAAGSYDLRPITLIYMPTNYIDHQRVSELGQAFSVLEGELPLGEDDKVYYSSDGRGYRAPVVIYNISPYDTYWGKACSGIEDGVVPDAFGNVTDLQGNTRTQAKVFQDYWNCLLTDQGANIVSVAERIFHDRILRKELKF